MEFNYDKNRIWLANEDGDAIAFVDFPEFEPGKVEVTHTVVCKAPGASGPSH